MTDDLRSYLETRLTLFRLLQAAYAAPPQPDLGEALQEAALVYNTLVDQDLPDLIPPRLPADSHEYHRLFVGPAALVAPPYESVYLGAEPCLMQEETLAVRSFYLAHGLALGANVSEPDDHLAFELEFYAHLQERTLKASTEPERFHLAAAQQTFWAEHLSRWVPAFVTRVIEGSTSPYFRSLAALTRAVVIAEHPILHALANRLVAKEENAV